MADNYVYVLNNTKTHSEALNHTYANRHDAFPATAFTNTAVNPILKNPGLGTTGQDSANFFEIRNAPTSVGSSTEPIISGNQKTRLVNRIIPSANNQTTLANYATNKQTTSSHKLRVYDPKASVTGEILAGSAGPGMDLETNDYFVLINPEITGDTDSSISIRPHFAKIKSLTTFDYYGDGIEFEPKYPNSISKGTNFEIYEGPPKTDTSVVAVSYGLRGKTDNTAGRTLWYDKYDVSSTVSRPTWYFYEERLNKANQLNYNTKYQLTTCRWFSDWTQKGNIKSSDASGQTTLYQTTNLGLVQQASQSWTSADIGRSIYTGLNAGNIEWVGNITGYDNTAKTLTIDYPRKTVNANAAGYEFMWIGRDVCQTIFLTEQEYGVNINDLGSKEHNAILVDNLRDKDVTEVGTDNASDFETGNYEYNPDRWGHCFRNHYRSTADKTTAHSDTFATGSYAFNHGNLTGPNRYLHYKSSNLKNNIVDPVMEASVNFPRNKMSQIARAKVMDLSGVQHLKLKEGHNFTVRNTLHSGNLGKFKLPYKATSDTSSGYKIRLTNLQENYDIRNDDFIKANDIIQVGKDYYLVSSVSAPATVSNQKTQDITVTKVKRDNDTTFSNITSMSFTDSDVYVRAWNGGLKGSFPIDTEVIYGSNAYKRLTLHGNTVLKTDSSLYQNKLVLLSPEYIGHDIPIEYGDSVHSHIKLSPTFTSKKYYQSSPISMLYYLSGNFAIDEEIFSGTVEDINSQNKQGMISYEITGRDKISKLLSNTTTKNLNHSNDLIYSSLAPMLDDAIDVTLDANLTATGTSTEIRITASQHSDGISVKPYDILMDSNGKLLGEISTVNSYAIVSGNYDYTVTLGAPNILGTQVNSGANAKLWQPRESNYITGIKAISSNPLASSYPNHFESVGDKGLVFVDGEKVVYNDTGTPIATTLTYDELAYSSATSGGGYNEDNSLGYDILDVNNIGTSDSQFAFKIGLENDATISKSSAITRSSASYYNVLDSVSQDGATTITLAPTFPVVLGCIDTNTSDSRFSSMNSYLYLVNRNLPSGGFLHTLKDDNTGYYVPKQTFKYQDLQELAPGDIKQTYTSVLNDGLKSQKIMGAAPSYCINALGGIISPTVTPSNEPKLGSNFNDENYTGNDKLASTLLPKEFPQERDLTETAKATTSIKDIAQKDYRTKRYELMALGDLYPDSKIRYNSLYKSSNFATYGLLTEKSAQKDSTSITHQNYTGGSKPLLRQDASYDIQKIDSASIAPTSIKRFGVMRLVEATFDWHFTPIDAESLKDIESVPSISNFSYPRFSNPTALGYDFTTSANGINFSGTGALSFKKNDMIYKSDGTLVARFNADGTIPNARPIYNTDITIFEPYYPSLQSGGFKTNVEVFDMLTDDGWGLNDRLNTNDMRHLNVYLIQQKISKDYFESNLLHTATSTNEFNPHNIFLPIIPQTYGREGVGSPNHDQYAYGPFHEEGDWGVDFDGDSASYPDTDDYATKYWHYSRVVNALQMPTFVATSNSGNNISPTQYNSERNAHLYDNCIGVFKHFRGSIKESQGSNQRDITTTSCLLELDTDARYQGWTDGVSGNASDDRYQHSRNLRVERAGSPNISLIGTKTKIAPFISEDGYVAPTRTSNHNDANSTTGEMYQSQMIIKPTINTTGMSASSTITLTMNAANTHSWIHYVPDLTGYYLTRVGDGKDCLKIISHEVTYSTGIAVHTLTLNANFTATQRYRLMRISETTFEDTPGYFELNKEIHNGLQYNDTATRFDTGEPATMSATTTNFTGEGIVSMYVLLDIDDDLDTNNKMVENIDLVQQTLELFTDGEVIDCCITDGNTTTRKIITVNKDTTTGKQSLRFDYEGKLSGNGIVSFGEVFTITSQQSLNASVERAYIGTTMSIGIDAEKAIEEILEENDIELNKSERNLIYTGAIVASDMASNATTISLETAIPTTVLANDDIIYNQEGKLIGVIGSGEGSTTLTLKDTKADVDTTIDVFYRPKANEELVKYNRKPFILNTKFSENDVFTAINFLGGKKGVEYKFEGDRIRIKDVDDYTSRRKYSLRYKDGQNLLSTENNTSVFDKANKVVVIGDNVKAVAEIPTTDDIKTIKHIDSNIKYAKEAQIKAEQLLALHQKETTKVTIELERKGEMKLMKPGDLITLNFKNHNIPADDYIVYEIENAMSAISKITVGTFNKTIAERLAEMNIEREGGFSTILTKEVETAVTKKTIFDDLNIAESSLHAQTSTPTGTMVGWTTLIGWTNTLGAGSDVVTTEEIQL